MLYYTCSNLSRPLEQFFLVKTQKSTLYSSDLGYSQLKTNAIHIEKFTTYILLLLIRDFNEDSTLILPNTLEEKKPYKFLQQSETSDL